MSYESHVARKIRNSLLTTRDDFKLRRRNFVKSLFQFSSQFIRPTRFLWVSVTLGSRVEPVEDKGPATASCNGSRPSSCESRKSCRASSSSRSIGWRVSCHASSRNIPGAFAAGPSLSLGSAEVELARGWRLAWKGTATTTSGVVGFSFHAST